MQALEAHETLRETVFQQLLAMQSAAKLLQRKLGKLTEHCGKQGFEQYFLNNLQKSCGKASLGNSRNTAGNTGFSTYQPNNL